MEYWSTVDSVGLFFLSAAMQKFIWWQIFSRLLLPCIFLSLTPSIPFQYMIKGETTVRLAEWSLVMPENVNKIEYSRATNLRHPQVGHPIPCLHQHQWSSPVQKKYSGSCMFSGIKEQYHFSFSFEVGLRVVWMSVVCSVPFCSRRLYGDLRLPLQHACVCTGKLG